jgi:hypothetical protein
MSMHALRYVPLIAASRLGFLVRVRARGLDRRSKVALGFVAAAIATLAYVRGAPVAGGLAGGQPGLLHAATSVTTDDQA